MEVERFRGLLSQEGACQSAVPNQPLDRQIEVDISQGINRRVQEGHFSSKAPYGYYRCTKYNKPGHPRTRVTEADLDHQVLALFDKMRIEDDAEKRKILEIVWLNCRLIDESLSPQIKKPFDVVVEGLLLPKSGGSWT